MTIIYNTKEQFDFYFRCAKDIDTLIESLPNEDSSQELQTQSLRRLEIENQEAAKHLEEASQLHLVSFLRLSIWMDILYLEIVLFAVNKSKGKISSKIFCWAVKMMVF